MREEMRDGKEITEEGRRKRRGSGKGGLKQTIACQPSL